MPWNDWQFWLATAAALAGLWFALRPFLPSRRDGDCGSCGPRTRPRRAELTIGDTDVTSASARARGQGPRAS